MEDGRWKMELQASHLPYPGRLNSQLSWSGRWKMEDGRWNCRPPIFHIPYPISHIPPSMADIKPPETKMPQYLGTGRRKTAVARVQLASGTGKILVNSRPFENYFPTETLRVVAIQPLTVTGTAGKYD